MRKGGGYCFINKMEGVIHLNILITFVVYDDLGITIAVYKKDSLCNPLSLVSFTTMQSMFKHNEYEDVIGA